MQRIFSLWLILNLVIFNFAHYKIKKGKWLPQEHADVNMNADEHIFFLFSVLVQQNVCFLSWSSRLNT